MLQKEIIVLGDVEMGAGNLTDDFISDNALSELIIELSKRKHPVDLVFNGDTFDFLKAPYFYYNRLTYPRHITEDISRTKLKSIHHAHPQVFQALQRFLKKSHHHVYFIIGNHDNDLVYKNVRHDLKKILNANQKVHFSWKYQQHQVYIEHGHQYDIINRINLKRLFLSYRGRSILNLPWLTFGLISKFMFVKEKHPFSERITNRALLFTHHKSLLFKMSRKAFSYLFKSIVYYPFRYYSDPTYSLPKGLWREVSRRAKKLNYDLDGIIPLFKQRGILKKAKIHILGHIHEKFIDEKEGRTIIHPGSWRDEYDLDTKTKRLVNRPKRYVQILVVNDNPEYQLIEFPIKRKSFPFHHVINNELKFIRQAAQEEGYEPIFY